jgi:hypothetical protein
MFMVAKWPYQAYTDTGRENPNQCEQKFIKVPRLIISIVSKSKMQFYVASQYIGLQENGLDKQLQRLLYYQEETTWIT